MARTEDIPIYKHGCDLLSLAVDVQTQMPRAYKRTVGDRIHDLCAAMLEDMAMANACREGERVEHIDNLLTRLRALTAMLRVGHDKKIIATGIWSRSVEVLDTIGAQAGGWKRATLKAIPATPFAPAA